MKYIPVIILTSISALRCNAQIPKGTFLSGGDGLLKMEETDYYKQFEAELNPRIGYFFNSNLALSVSPQFYYRYWNPTNSITDAGNSNTFAIGLSPEVDYYFGEMNLKPYLHFGIPVRFNTRIAQDSHKSEFSWGLNPGGGILYSINENIGIFGLLTYRWNDSRTRADYFDDAVSESDNSFQVSVGFSIFFAKDDREAMVN